MLLKLIWSPIHYVRPAIDSSGVAAAAAASLQRGWCSQPTQRLDTKTSAEGLAYFRRRMF
jgi:hypothetical protein